MAIRTESKAEVTSSGRKERHLMNELISLLAFGVFAVIWLAFGYALVASQGSLDRTYEWLRGLPLIAQAAVAFLTLPVAIGLWVWETSWPLLVRLPLVIGLGAWNLAIFFPRWLIGR
jgi:hypothetical protein